MLSPRALNRISATLLTVIGVVIIISALQTA
jgi:hypothetical protein